MYSSIGQRGCALYPNDKDKNSNDSNENQTSNTAFGVFPMVAL